MIEAFPLCWPADKVRTPSMARKRAAFNKKGSSTSSSWISKKQLTVSDAVDRVLVELDKYNRAGQLQRIPRNSNIIISTNVRVKRDGLPYSGEREPADPGVAVYFSLDKKPYCLPCDKWDRVADNIAAIAAHINAMRGIERWGVGDSHDVFTGFKALPESSSSEKGMWMILGLSSQPADVNVVHSAYKSMAKKVHPDMPDGDDILFTALQQAYQKALTYFPKPLNQN